MRGDGGTGCIEGWGGNGLGDGGTTCIGDGGGGCISPIKDD